MAMGLIVIAAMVGLLGIGAIGLFVASSGNGNGVVIGGVVMLGVLAVVAVGGIGFFYVSATPAPMPPHAVSSVSMVSATPGNGVRLELTYEKVPHAKTDKLVAAFDETVDGHFETFEGPHGNSKSSSRGLSSGSGRLQFTLSPQEPAELPKMLEAAKKAEAELESTLAEMGIADLANVRITDDNGVEISFDDGPATLPNYQEPVEVEVPTTEAAPAE